MCLAVVSDILFCYSSDFICDCLVAKTFQSQFHNFLFFICCHRFLLSGQGHFIKYRRTVYPGNKRYYPQTLNLYSVFPAYNSTYPFTISRKCAFEGASVFRLLTRRDLYRPSPVTLSPSQKDKFPNLLEFIRWIVILIPCLLIMTRFTKRLPITLIPEQLLVTTMRYNMINDSGLG